MPPERCIHRFRGVECTAPRGHAKKNLTIRNIPPALGEALDREKRRRGASLNQAVIDVLSQGLGADEAGLPRNGLKALAGTWSASEFEGFERAVAATGQVDEELWR